ncbi:centromere-localized protein 2 [Geosmithia morbida]|uniref:Centromere-localized protein 2 n=1 Tax=Geosmithia morbida TaxID=1094350 RepID=A0A9P4Z492_9HYPO|nr:centromere-localized protein 2 [Geosmithia morbida]KAF4126359.1 centromere-localized protein 2 [Geosmithia morbida]
MAPTEAQVLTSYLIRPASLDAILTYDAFAERFPPPQRDSPAVRALWKDLVSQRERLLDEVRAAIEAEVVRGQAMKREIIRARREAERDDEPDGEKHNLDSIVVELEGAADAVEAEMARLQDEEATLREEIAQTIGGLSDLRYGRFADGNVSSDVVDALGTLSETCRGKA